MPIDDDKKYPRVTIGPITAQVMPEVDIVAEAKDNLTFVVMAPVDLHPLPNGGIPGAIQAPCSSCGVICWQAPSTQKLLKEDIDKRLIVICLNCVMAMKRDE